jgi:hypothetical protein
MDNQERDKAPDPVASARQTMNQNIAAAKEKKEAAQQQERESEAARKAIFMHKFENVGEARGEQKGDKEKDEKGEERVQYKLNLNIAPTREKTIADLIVIRQK